MKKKPTMKKPAPPAMKGGKPGKAGKNAMPMKLKKGGY